MTGHIVVITERANQPSMRAFLRQLEQLGYAVHILRQLVFEQIMRQHAPQAVLVDITSQVFRQGGGSLMNIRGIWEQAPIVLLSCAEEVGQVGYQPGLQDFLSLPIALPELGARLRFSLHKVSVMPVRDEFALPGFLMNLATHEVWVQDEAVPLTHKEFELLKYFTRNPRRVLTRSELMDSVWQSEFFEGTRTVDVHVLRLRTKLGTPICDMIHTVRNVGYRFG